MPGPGLRLEEGALEGREGERGERGPSEAARNTGRPRHGTPAADAPVRSCTRARPALITPIS